jgi:hypothetical protein
MIDQSSVWESWLVDIMSDPEWGYVRGIHLYTWIGTIIAVYIIGLIFFLRAKHSTVISQKWFFRSFGLFLVFMGLTRISFVFAYFIEPYYNLLLAAGYAFASVALLPLVFTLEKWMFPQTKKFFSIVGVTLTVLSFYFVIFQATDSEISRMIQNIGMPIMILAFLMLYIFMIRVSTGSVRKKAIRTLLGIIIFVAGILLDSEGLLESVYIAAGMSLVIPVMFISPIVFAIGLIIIGASQKMD